MLIAKLIDCSSVLRPYTIRKVARIESNDNLMHYGIKGMKRGVRRTKEQLAHDRSSIQARMNSKLRTPVKASNGILVTRFSDHALDRTQTESRPVTVEGILDALKNPLNHGSIKTKTDNLGRPSQQFIGKSATVAVNPENGTITTTWCTGSRTKQSLGLDCNFNGLSETDEYWADIEEKVGNFLTLKCLDEHYNPDSNGIICESILNKIPV